MSSTAPIPVNFLLVDDREANLLALEQLLRRDGLNLLKARSGAEALDLLLKHDIALAVLDVRMPDMDGFELAEIMRGSDRTRRIPIMFVTAGSSDPRRRFEGYEKGAVDYLEKPIENDVLRSKADVFYDLYAQRVEVSRHRDEVEKISRENERLLEESRKVAAELEKTDKRKDEFLATLAHELRNPLSPILSGIQLLGMMAGDEEPEENREMREMIERQVHHMVRLVDDLLEVSRITSGKINLETKPMNLSEAVRQAAETSRPNTEANHHLMTVHPPDGPDLIDGDMTRMTQVISNLINNAARYTPDSGKIDVFIHSDSDHVSVIVKDSGIGIPPEQLTTVFELFTQLKRNHSQSKSGLGIGLALVKRIVELHNGWVSLASDGEGKGSEFTVTLPLLRSDLQKSEPPSAPETSRSDQRKILAIDDNADALTTLSGLLTAMGHQVMTASGGKEGIEIFKNFHPSCVFLDIGMPEMDGYEVARRLRLLPGGEHVQLFALTGWGQEQDRIRTSAAGFDHHVVKPVSKNAIEGMLNTIDSAN